MAAGLASCGTSGGSQASDTAPPSEAATSAPVTSTVSSQTITTTPDTITTIATPSTTTVSASTTSRSDAANGDTAGSSTTTTTVAVRPLRILVTNDDGIGAPGIDVLVDALGELPDVDVLVVAPAVNQSGTSDARSDGDVVGAPAGTASGLPGTAVDGTPADAVTYAFDELDLAPDVVVSGVNTGQNIGPFVELSGTVGAARTGARHGVPAVAVSAGLDGGGYRSAAEYVIDFVAAHRGGDGSLDLDVSVTSFNVPDCSAGGSVRELVAVPVAVEFPADVDPFAADCTSTEVDPADDHAALAMGFASMSTLDY